MNRHGKRRLRTKKKLQEAAMALVLENGFENLTVQQITERADLGRGTFYIHFKDREDVIWSMIEEGFIKADRAAHRRIELVGLPAEPERIGFINMLSHAAQNKDLYRIMLGSQGSSMLTRRAHAFLAADLEKEMKMMPTLFNLDIPSDVTAQIVTGAVVSLVIWWAENDETYSIEELANMLYRAFRFSSE